MSDLKTERLLNLTMALLATGRFLTKEEIFFSVAGYSGTQESMERMFERDKDDLRKMGIEIDVEPIDPFFEDEMGYKILPQKYSLEIPEFTPAEVALLSLAGQSWRNQSLSTNAQRALRKLESMGIELDEEVLSNRVVAIDNSNIDFQILWEALLEHRQLVFTYETKDVSERKLHPYGLTLLQGEWYIAGFDLDRKAQRIFKVRRMSAIKVVGKDRSFEVPSDFDISSLFAKASGDSSLKARLKVRKGKARTIRENATFEQSDSHWDYMVANFVSMDEALREILWYGSDIICLEPLSLKNKILALMNSRIAEVNHG